MNTAPRMNFYLSIGNRLYGESCLPTLGRDALRQAGKQKQINLGFAEGALSFVYEGQELFGIELWDYLEGYVWTRHFNDLLAGKRATHKILYEGFVIEMMPHQEWLYLKTYFKKTPERIEQETYLPLLPFIHESIRFTHRLFCATWLWDPDVGDRFKQNWREHIQGQLRGIVDMAELEDIMEGDLTTLLENRNFYEVYEQTNMGFVAVEDW